jgi:hypothetical protein
MTPNHGEADENGYLWDPHAPIDVEVEALERALAPLRFEHRRRALTLPPAPRTAPWRQRTLAIAATIALVAIGTAGLWKWRESWPSGRAWPLVLRDGARFESQATLALDRPIAIGPQSSARADIARIGEMIIEPASAVTLIETSSTRHRVALERGAIHVRVWAPPGRFGVRTPGGTAVDLGCIFSVSVDEKGQASAHVQTGWIELYNAWGESLIPAGAIGTMTASSAPTVPVYEDATPAFTTSVRAFQNAGDDGTRMALVDHLARSARARDVLTLLMLAKDATPRVKRALLERAAQLRPPPAGLTVDEVVAQRERLWDWAGSLGLPPAKNWWLNWRDFFRRLDH